MHCICSYPPYLQAVPFVRKQMCRDVVIRMVMVTIIITVILAKHCIRLSDDGSLVIRNMLEQF